MAEFLNKEAVSVGAVPQAIASQANNEGNLAKDLGTLMQSFGGIAQDYHKSMITQSEQVGSTLARDSLTAMIKAKQQTIQAMIDNPREFNYEEALRDADMSMATTIADADSKLGKDSVAKKAYDNVFLMRATELNEGFKTNIFKQYKETTNALGLEANAKELASNGNMMGKNAVESWYNSNKVFGATDEWQSAHITTSLLGGFINSEFDVKKVFPKGSAKPDIGLQQKEFNKHFDSIAQMNKDGSISAKFDWVRAEDLAKIKQNWDTKINSVVKANNFNMDFHMAINRAEDDLNKRAPNTFEEARQQSEARVAVVKENFFKASSPSNSDSEKYLKFMENEKDKLDSFERAYNVSQNTDASYIGKVLLSGVDTNGMKVDVETTKKLLIRKNNVVIDTVLTTDKLTDDQKIAELNTVIKNEQATGVTSTAFKPYFDDALNYSSKNVDNVKQALKNVKIALSAGYTTPDARYKNEIIDQKLKTISDMQLSNKPSDEIITKLHQIDIDYTQDHITKLPENVGINYQIIEQGFKDDDIVQDVALGNWVSKAVAGEVKWATPSGSGSEMANALAKQLAYDGIKLDGTKKISDDINKDMIQKSGYLKNINNPFWNAFVTIVPSTNNNGVVRAMDGNMFMDAVLQKVVDIESSNKTNKDKKITAKDISQDDLKFLPVPSRQGMRVSIIYKGTDFGTVGGNELEAIWAKMPNDNKNFTNEDYTKNKYKQQTKEDFTVGQD